MVVVTAAAAEPGRRCAAHSFWPLERTPPSKSVLAGSMSRRSTKPAFRGESRIPPRSLGSQRPPGTPPCNLQSRLIWHALHHSPRELRGHRSSSGRLADESIARAEPLPADQPEQRMTGEPQHFLVWSAREHAVLAPM